MKKLQYSLLFWTGDPHRQPPHNISRNFSPGTFHSFCVFVCMKHKSAGNFTSDWWHFGWIGSLKRWLWSSWLFIMGLLLSFPLLTPPWRHSTYQNYQSHKWRSELLWQEMGGASNQPIPWGDTWYTWALKRCLFTDYTMSAISLKKNRLIANITNKHIDNDIVYSSVFLTLNSVCTNVKFLRI